MAETTYLEAIGQALREEMDRDPAVVLLGEDVGVYGGAFKDTAGLLERFGWERVIDTPISETAIVGAVVGMSYLGLRPVAEIMAAHFIRPILRCTSCTPRGSKWSTRRRPMTPRVCSSPPFAITTRCFSSSTSSSTGGSRKSFRPGITLCRWARRWCGARGAI